MSKVKTTKAALEAVKEAIVKLHQPQGVSRQALSKYLKSECGLENPALLKAALKTGVDSKQLAQKGQSFLLFGTSFQQAADEVLGIQEIEEGVGQACKAGDTVIMSYVGTLLSDGTKFDSSTSFSFELGAGEVIKGWDKGIVDMRVGQRRILTIPPKLGYGKRGSPPEIPGDATLVFDVTLKGIKS